MHEDTAPEPLLGAHTGPAGAVGAAGPGHTATRHKQLEGGRPGRQRAASNTARRRGRSASVALARRTGARQAVSPDSRVMERR